MAAHWKAKHWVGGSAAPATPTLTVNTGGTVATVTGATAGTTNTVYVVSASTVASEYTWEAVGSRTGDGTISLNLAAGFYWAYVLSSNAGGSAASALVYFLAGTAGDGAFTLSPAYIVSKLLVQLGLATNPDDGAAWPTFASSEPPVPDQVITVYDTSPTDEGRIMVNGEPQGHFGIQFRTRAKDARTGYAKAYSLFWVLSKQVNNTVVTTGGNSYIICNIARMKEPLQIGTEPGGKRFIHTSNAVVAIRPL